MSVASPSCAAFPGSQAGRHPRLHFRGLLRLHSNYGPLDRSTAQGGLCHRASIHPVTRINRLPATRSNRQLSGWFLPPLVIRAFWAHYDPEVVCDGVALAACRTYPEFEIMLRIHYCKCCFIAHTLQRVSKYCVSSPHSAKARQTARFSTLVAIVGERNRRWLRRSG